MKTPIDVTFTVTGGVKVDMDRVVEDPWWNLYTGDLDLEDPQQLQLGLSRYVQAYLKQEILLSDVPWSCGPADLYQITIEVRNGGREASNDDKSGSPSPV